MKPRHKNDSGPAPLSVPQQILKKVKRHGRGRRVYTAQDFVNLGSSSTVSQALHRLASQDHLRRVGKGFYDWPRFNPLLKKHAPPNVDQIAQSIARRDGTRLLPSGLEAANKLGLTNAVSVQPVYVTDGPNRTYKIGGNKIQFRHARPKRIQWAGRPGGIVIQALSWLGQDRLQSNPDLLSQLRRRLPDEVKDDLAKGLHDCPSKWLVPVIKNVVEMSE